MSEGYIYIMLNRAFQNDHYKIGMTTNAPEARARELSSATGIPRGFEVLYEQRVTDCKKAERLLHHRLHRYRLAGNREFFDIPLKVAIKALEDVADEIGRVDSVASAGQNSPAVEDAKPPPSDEITVIPSVPRRTVPAAVTFEDHTSYTDAARRLILHDLRDGVLGLDDRLRETERCRSFGGLTHFSLAMRSRSRRACSTLALMSIALPWPSYITFDWLG